MQNEVLPYMVEIEQNANQIVVVEGEISLGEMVDEYNKTGDFVKPVKMRREAKASHNITRLHKALFIAVKRLNGKKVEATGGVYTFPITHSIKNREDFLEYLDVVF